jgi:hypothetical protein
MCASPAVVWAPAPPWYVRQVRLSVRAHRWLGVVLIAPLAIWTVTGLLFGLKPGWRRAYELLAVERPGEAIDAATLVVAPGSLGRVERLELFSTALGPVYRVTRDGAVSLVDGRTGQALSPLDAARARALAEDAVARSPHRAAYGGVSDTIVGDREVVVRFAGGPEVTVDRDGGRLAQRGRDTARIDWLYRLHYLQWTGVAVVDRALPVVAIVAVWLLSGMGVWLLLRRRLRREVAP